MPITEAEIKEFWEKCGLTVSFYKGIYENVPIWVDGNGEIVSQIDGDFPSVDLNNLFKYAVPMALGELAKQGYCPPMMKLFQLWYDALVTLSGDSGNTKDAATALFRVLQRVFKGG